MELASTTKDTTFSPCVRHTNVHVTLTHLAKLETPGVKRSQHKGRCVIAYSISCGRPHTPSTLLDSRCAPLNRYPQPNGCRCTASRAVDRLLHALFRLDLLTTFALRNLLRGEIHTEWKCEGGKGGKSRKRSAIRRLLFGVVCRVSSACVSGQDQ